MNHLKQFLFSTLLLVVYLLSTGSAFANSAVKLSNGINLSTNNPRLGDNLTVSFSLQETENMAVNDVRVQVLMRSARGGANILLSDFGQVNFTAGRTAQLSFTYSLATNNDLKPGTYILAVVYTSVNGDTVVFDEINNATNRLRVEVASKTLGFEGYVFKRTDAAEFRWVGRLPNGQFGHTWIDEQCANAIGAAPQSGDWEQLSWLAPAGDVTIENPCSVGVVTQNTGNLASGVMINPSVPVVGERFEVSFDLAETQNRPAFYSNVQVAIEANGAVATVDLGALSLDPYTTRRFKAQFGPTHGLVAGTYQAVVRYQLTGGALTNFDVQGEGSNSQEFQIQPAVTMPESTAGFVFSRTDSNELRWIGETAGGEYGHTWIDEQCAQTLGGVSNSGTWLELQALAPAGDQSVSNPCERRDEVIPTNFINDGEGYVFNRGYEYRWISRASSGEFGHTWISAECAFALGGPKVAGDWQRLISLAPAGDQTVSNPCDNIRSFIDGGEGYVFGRTDSAEFRWIGRAPNGEIGHTWIDQQCAQSLGGVSAKGNWNDLQKRAPAGDGLVVGPC